MQQLGNLLLEGKITLRAWQEQFAESLKILHSQQYLLGVGGQSQIQKEDYLVLARELKNQYKYLRNFAVDLTKGVMSPAQFKIRAAMYAKAAKVSFFKGEKQAAKRSGLDGAYRILGKSDYHCPQCPQYAAKGVVPIDEVIYPTQQCDCRTGCLCNLVYVKLEDAIGSTSFTENTVSQAKINLKYLEFANPYRDNRGRFAKKDSINLPSVDEIRTKIYNNSKKDTEGNKNLIIGGKNYQEIVKDKGLPYADEQLNNELKRLAQILAVKQYKKLERHAQEQAFKELYPNAVLLTLDDLKKDNPDAFNSLLERYNKKKKVLNLGSVTDRGVKYTKNLSSQLLNAAEYEEKLKVIGNFRESLLKNGMSKQEASGLVESKKIYKSMNSNDKKITIAAATEFYQMTNGLGSKTLEKFKADNLRAYADDKDKSINIGLFTDLETIWHEMGHHLEFEDEEVAKVARDWRDSRASSQTPVSLNDLVVNGRYKDNEKAKPDKYISPYVGKVYNNGFTEVISMGIAQFHSSESMLEFYNQDKKHFQFIVGLMKRV
ncbi:MAG: hypothetical protein V7L23_29830 [Nostoc sp.]|uniref:hypothetical protein n=1 Tax=Nostoc sp. TaxID=1180 RepID=UPI002FF06327